MTIPQWYTDFWCPSDMREIDPQGCGLGLGIGAFLFLIALIALATAIVTAVVYFWPVREEKDS